METKFCILGEEEKHIIIENYFKQISISGELYNVPMDKLVEIKSQYPDPKDKAKMIEAIIAVSTKIEIESL